MPSRTSGYSADRQVDPGSIVPPGGTAVKPPADGSGTEYYAFRLKDRGIPTSRVVLWSTKRGEIGEALVEGPFEKVKSAVDAIVQWELGGDVRWEFVNKPETHPGTKAYFAQEDEGSKGLSAGESLCDQCVMSPTCVVSVHNRSLGLGLAVVDCRAFLGGSE